MSEKMFYQVIYKEIGKIDGDFNTEGSYEIFNDKIDAWLHVLQDCENDRDIAYLMERVSSGEIEVKTLKAKEI